MNIFVAKLSPETTGDDLRALFEQYGTVDTAKVIFDHETGNSRGFGFVEMPNEDEGFEAVNSLNDTDIQGSRVVIKEARPQGEYQTDGRPDDRGGFYQKQAPYERDRAPYGQNRGGGGFDNRGPAYGQRGGYDNRGGGGYDNRGGFPGNRGGYDNRGGGNYNNRGGGGYDNNRGFDRNNRGGYDNNRSGGFNNNRGGYDNNRGYDRGSYDRGSYDRNSWQGRDRFGSNSRPPSREDEDLYRFEEFIGNDQ